MHSRLAHGLALLPSLALAAAIHPSGAARVDCLDGPVGGGPYPACIYTDPTLANHTIYMPANPPRSQPLSIVAWANGGCSFNGTAFQNFLSHIASHGVLVIASGPPNGSGDDTTPQYLSDSILWASAKAGTWGRYADVDASNVAVAGQSCGGLEAYRLRNDERVKGLGIFNSGLLRGESAENNPIESGVEDAGVIKEFTKPVFWFVGGQGDVAYPNAVADYSELPADIPKWIGQFNVGHSGTYQELNGGAFGVAAVNWLQWLLKGDETAAAFFEGPGAVDAGWTDVEGENLEDL